MLKIENLNQYYSGSHILRGLSFEVEPGKVTSLLGRNGVGKTTLMKCLMGVVKSKSGSITFENKDITHAPSHERVKAGIGYVPQGREIFPRLTVEENLLMGLATKPGGTKIPDLVFELFPVLRSMLNRRGGDLSGGQQQRVAIARALCMSPDIMLFDEPTSALDPELTVGVLNTMRQLAEEQMTMIVVTHEMGFAHDAANNVIFMADGNIIEKAPPQDFFNNPQEERTKSFLKNMLK